MLKMMLPVKGSEDSARVPAHHIALSKLLGFRNESLGVGFYIRVDGKA